MEQTGAGTGPQSTLMHFLWEFQAFAWQRAHTEGGITRVAFNPSRSAGFTRQLFRRVKLGAMGLVPPAALLATSSLKL